VDEFNRPLYGGDVFGLTAQNGAAGSGQGQAAQALVPSGEPVERTLWGELQPRDEESEEEESEDEDEADEDEDLQAGLQTPGGLETPGGFVSSVPTDLPGQGVETSIAGEMDLRKARRGFDTEESTHPRSAYTVLPEKQARVEGFFGSDRIYDLKAARGNVPVLGQEDETKKRKKPGDVDVAIDLDSLQQHDGISKDALRRKFEEGKKEDGIGAQWSAYDEDLSEMIAQESRKRQKVEEKSTSKKRESKYRF
jgi:splicing factor 3B subunit 2